VDFLEAVSAFRASGRFRLIFGEDLLYLSFVGIAQWVERQGHRLERKRTARKNNDVHEWCVFSSSETTSLKIPLPTTNLILSRERTITSRARKSIRTQLPPPPS
jgi:hypothetical protein